MAEAAKTSQFLQTIWFRGLNIALEFENGAARNNEVLMIVDMLERVLRSSMNAQKNSGTINHILTLMQTLGRLLTLIKRTESDDQVAELWKRLEGFRKLLTLCFWHPSTKIRVAALMLVGAHPWTCLYKHGLAEERDVDAFHSVQELIAELLLDPVAPVRRAVCETLCS